MKKCKICKAISSPIVDEKTSKIYYKCSNCEYIFLDKLFFIDENLEKKHYDKHHNNLESVGYVQMFQNLIEEFVLAKKEHISSALDFGCGEGEVLPIILERNGLSCDRYDLFYFPEKTYKDKTYDLILSTEVIEHLDKPLEMLNEILSHINKNAYLILMTAFHPLDEKEFLKWWYIRDITHIGFFTIKTFEYIAKELNLKIVKHNDKNTIMFQKLI